MLKNASMPALFETTPAVPRIDSPQVMSLSTEILHEEKGGNAEARKSGMKTWVANPNTFRVYYDRGLLPVQMSHDRTIISWKSSPFLDNHFDFLPIFITGFFEDTMPYSVAAYRGAEKLIISAKNRNGEQYESAAVSSLIFNLDEITRQLRIVIKSSHVKAIAKALRFFQLLLNVHPLVGTQIQHLKKLIPCISKLINSKKSALIQSIFSGPFPVRCVIGDLARETIIALHEQGGEEMYTLIKLSVPTYDYV